MSNKKVNNNGKQEWKRNQSRGNKHVKDYEKDSKDIAGSKAKAETYNDPEWYAQNEQLLKDAASFAFATPLGGHIDVGAAYSGVKATSAIPGIMSIGCALVPGRSEDNSSPVNIAARNLYSFVRHKNSGHSNYDSPDLMLYLLAMDQLYAAHAWMVRAYGAMRFYLPTNRYLAKCLIQAMGFNFTDLETHLADFRAFINTVGLKISSLCVPKTMSYFKRHRWMFSNIWMDAPSVKAQMYVFRPDCFGKYTEMTGDVPYGVLTKKALPIGATGMALTGLQKVINEMISSVIESEDMNIMSGDILKAYGPENLIVVPPISEDYVVQPVYNQAVLSQIHNLREFGAISESDLVTQDPATGAIKCLITGTVKHQGSKLNAIFDGISDVPTPGDVMVASRLTYIAKAETQGPGTVAVTPDSLGTEVVTSMHIWRFETVTDGSWDIASHQIHSIIDATIPLTGTDVTVERVCDISKFDWHPIINVFEFNDDGTITTFQGVLADLTNATVMSTMDLKKMHECALLSMFNVPEGTTKF